MADKKIKIIGIDVGGTKILLQTFDEKLNLIDEILEKTETEKGKKGFIDQLYRLIDNFYHKGIKGIGIAVPGIVDINKGELVYAPHLPGHTYPIKKLIEKRYKTKVFVDNDINGFLTAEMKSKKMQKYSDVTAIMVGTGLGGAIIANGKMVYGKKGFAGEAGHIIVDDSSDLKTLEQNTSGFFVPKIAKKLGIKNKMTAYDLEKNTSDSNKIVKHITDNLGIGLANLNNILNPEVFVLGGSIYKLFVSKRKKELEKVIKKYSLNKDCPKIIDANSKTSVARGMAIKIRDL